MPKPVRPNGTPNQPISSLAVSPNQGSVNRFTDSVQACPLNAVIDTQYTLATYRVLSVDQHNQDTAVVAAQIVTAAVDMPDSLDLSNIGRREAFERLKTDTGHWTMIRQAPSYKWYLCGASREWYYFNAGGEDSATRWIPSNASWATVQRLVDSLRHAQH